jgi:hypothetical protein
VVTTTITITINRYHELGHRWLETRHLTYQIEQYNSNKIDCRCNFFKIPDSHNTNSDNVSSKSDENLGPKTGDRPVVTNPENDHSTKTKYDSIE